MIEKNKKMEPLRRPSEIRCARDFVNFTGQAKDAKIFLLDSPDQNG